MTGIEEWRIIPGHPLYEVSSLGRVRSLIRSKPRVLIPWPAKSGHLYIALGRSNKYAVHRLVALAFHGPRPAGLVIRHLDSNPTNNRPSNLAYGTQSQNLRDGVLAGTHVHAKKTQCPRGHEYTPENTRVYTMRNGFPGRWCRACEPIRLAASAARRQGAA